MSFLQKCLVIVAAAWQLPACGKVIGIEDLPEVAPDATPAPVYTVRGTAVGLLAPVSVRLEHPDGFELLTIEQDGTFAFEAQLGDGAIYSVTLLGDPPCVLEDASGVVQGDIPMLALVCERAALAALEVSGPVAPRLNFKPLRRDYEVQISLLQQHVQITATAISPEATIIISGMPVESGVPSEPIHLTLGQNDIDIAVANANGVQRIYRVNLQRSAAPAQYAYGKASNTGAEDRFGARVAVWGDLMAVGAPGEDSGATGVNGDADDESLSNSGAVYVFRRTETGWIQEAYLKASNPGTGPELGDSFGRSLALREDTLIVGARGEDSSATGVDGNQADDSAEDSGAAYVFRRKGNSWVQEAYLKASNTEAFDGFGSAVAVGDDVVAVGAPGEDSSAPGVNADESDNSMRDSGAVYIFRRDVDLWRQEAYVKASNPGGSEDFLSYVGDKFGDSLALWDDTLAVGADTESSAATGVNGDQDNDDARFSGAVYVFRRQDALWAQEAYIKASNTDSGDQFGFCVSLWEDTLAVGTPWEESRAAGVNGDQDDDTLYGAGAVYMFRRSATSWAQEAYIKASSTGAWDRFGASIALRGQTLAVGAPGESSSASGVDGEQDDNLAWGSGAAYLFHRSGDTWVQGAYFKASNPDGALEDEFSGDFFGQGIALSRDSLVASASLEDSRATGVDGDENDDSAVDSGAVYIFH